MINYSNNNESFDFYVFLYHAKKNDEILFTERYSDCYMESGNGEDGTYAINSIAHDDTVGPIMVDEKKVYCTSFKINTQILGDCTMKNLNLVIEIDGEKKKFPIGEITMRKYQENDDDIEISTVDAFTGNKNGGVVFTKGLILDVICNRTILLEDIDSLFSDYPIDYKNIIITKKDIDTVSSLDTTNSLNVLKDTIYQNDYKKNSKNKIKIKKGHYTMVIPFAIKKGQNIILNSGAEIKYSIHGKEKKYHIDALERVTPVLLEHNLIKEVLCLSEDNN